MSTDSIKQLEKQIDEFIKEQPDEIEKFSKELEKIVKKSEKEGIDLDLGDFLHVSAKVVFNKEKTENKNRVKRSFTKIADWTLHHRYIYEVFNPVEEIKEKKSLKERLPELPWWYELTLIRSLPAMQIYDWVSPSYKVVWRSEQAPKLDDIKIEKVLNIVSNANRITPPANVAAQNQAIKKIIFQMASHLARKNGKIQSDHIIELYERAYKQQYPGKIFSYFYTDYERRSPFHYKSIKQNADSTSNSTMYYVGQTMGGLINSAIKFGTSLIAAIKLEIPKKCYKVQ